MTVYYCDDRPAGPPFASPRPGPLTFIVLLGARRVFIPPRIRCIVIVDTATLVFVSAKSACSSVLNRLQVRGAHALSRPAASTCAARVALLASAARAPDVRELASQPPLDCTSPPCCTLAVRRSGIVVGAPEATASSATA